MKTKTKSKVVVKQVRTRYSPEFKQQALARAAQEGVAVAANGKVLDPVIIIK